MNLLWECSEDAGNLLVQTFQFFAVFIVFFIDFRLSHILQPVFDGIHWNLSQYFLPVSYQKLVEL